MSTESENRDNASAVPPALASDSPPATATEMAAPESGAASTDPSVDAASEEVAEDDGEQLEEEEQEETGKKSLLKSVKERLTPRLKVKRRPKGQPPEKTKAPQETDEREEIIQQLEVAGTGRDIRHPVLGRAPLVDVDELVGAIVYTDPPVLWRRANARGQD